MIELVSIRKYEFSDGTTLHMKIDFEHNDVSFVEPEFDKVGNTYRVKKWLFAGRGVEYMAGWYNILGAMQFCILDAKKELEAYQKQKKQKLIDIMVAVQAAEEAAKQGKK